MWRVVLIMVAFLKHPSMNAFHSQPGWKPYLFGETIGGFESNFRFRAASVAGPKFQFQTTGD
jgi:hypothetical protein